MADFSLSVGAGDAGGGNQHGANCYGSVWESGTDTAGNYSTVSWSLSASYYCRAYYTWGGSTRSNAGYLDMVINGNVVGTITMSITNGWGNGASIGSTSGSVNIGHGSDGNGSCSAYIRVRTGEDNRRVGVVYSSGQSGSQTITLSSIKRASQPSINTWPGNSPDITCGQACTIHMNQGNTPFTHTISWSFGNLSDQTTGFAKTSGIQANVQWTPPISMMSQIPNAKTGTGSIKLTTWNGSTNIGTKYCNFTLHQPSDSAPTISSVTYAENGTLADGSTKLSSKGVDNTTVIGQISKKVITIAASTKYSSTLSKITCTHNGSTQTATTSPASFTFNYPVNTGDNKSYFSWTITDSRGNSTSDFTNMDYVNYIKPVVAVTTPKRDSSTVSTGKLSGSGMFFNGTVGSIANSVTVTYTYNSAEHTASITKSGNDWSFSGAGLTGVDPNGNYSITVKATDTIGFSSNKTVVLPKATPTLWVGDRTVKANDYLIVNNDMKVGGKTLLDRTYPVGAIYMSVNSTSPAILFGGTWEEITGRFMLAHDNSHPAGSTGGEYNHTLTVNEMPAHSHSTNIRVADQDPTGRTSGTNGWLIDGASAVKYTDSVGGGKAHNNMPPYLSVYMWRRTA